MENNYSVYLEIMAMAKQSEDIPTAEPLTESTFLKDVAQMATLAEEAIRKLRTEVHGDSFKFKDLDLPPSSRGSLAGQS